MTLGGHITTTSIADDKSNRGVPSLLTRLLRRELSGVEETIDLPGSADDWNRLRSVARRHRIFPLVYMAIKRIHSTALPSDWRDDFRSNAGRSLQLTGELFKLLDELHRQDIPAIPFKGLTMAARVYADVALREAGDLDLLVRREEIVPAVDVLVAAGLRPIYPTATPAEQRYLSRLHGLDRSAYLRSHSEHHLVCDRRQVNVDLHASITLREFGIRWDMDGMWNRATSFPLAGRQVSCLCHEDLMLVLCANGAKDGWDGLDRVCDVAAMLRNTNEREGINWERMFALAEQAGMIRILALGLWLAHKLFSSPLPESVEARLQSDSATQRIGSHLRDRLLSERVHPDSRVRRARLYLQLRERWRDRARCCLEYLRPGVGDWAALPLPSPLHFLHYPIRPLRLICRYGVELFRPPAAVRSDSASASRYD